MRQLSHLQFRAAIHAAHALTLLAALAASLICRDGHATMIFNTTTNTTGFSDSYENQALNALPTTANITPGPGAWATSGGVNGSNTANANNIHASNGTGGDPALPLGSTKYMEFQRLATTSTDSSRTRATINFDGTIGASDTMEFRTLYYLPDSASAISFTLEQTGTVNAIFSIYAKGDTFGGGWTVNDDSNPAFTTSMVTLGTPGQWHVLDMQYTAGTSLVKFSVDDGAAETIDFAGAGGSPGTPGRIQFNANAYGFPATHYYLDAAPFPAPEPATSSLFAIAAMWLLRMRRHSWRKAS